MTVVELDARRYVWCRGHALWLFGGPTRGLLEDLHGAAKAGQSGLLRYSARMIGDACAVALNLIANHDRPIPSASMRASWALERLAEHKLRTPCWELIRGLDDLPDEEVVRRCDLLVDQVRDIVGETPDILSPEGYYPAIALARDWLRLMEAAGEQGFLPKDWTRDA